MQLGDHAAEALAGLTALTALALGDTSIGEAGVRALARARRLRRLDLHENDGILAGAAAALAGLAGTLVSLDVQSCPVRSQRGPRLRVRLGFALVHQYRNSYTLPLNLFSRPLNAGALRQLGDAGVLALGALTRLTHLHVGRTRVRDDGLRVLRGLPALQQLNLASNAITDTGSHSLWKLDYAFLLLCRLRGPCEVCQGLTCVHPASRPAS